jgi:tricorn protease
MRNLIASIGLAGATLLPLVQSRAATPPLLHTPTISDAQIVLVYGDELWTVPREGGTARLLTSGPGVKSSPALSPDGKWLAFSLDFESNVDVYVMPAEGGN